MRGGPVRCDSAASGAANRIPGFTYSTRRNRDKDRAAASSANMLTPMLETIASLARLDFSPQHRQPPVGRVLLATGTAIVGSLAADAILVAIGEAIFPRTQGYVH